MANRTSEILVGGALIWIGWVSVTINDTSKLVAVSLAQQDEMKRQQQVLVKYIIDPNMENYKGLLLSARETATEKKTEDVSLRWEVTNESRSDEGISRPNAG